MLCIIWFNVCCPITQVTARPYPMSPLLSLLPSTSPSPRIAVQVDDDAKKKDLVSRQSDFLTPTEIQQKVRERERRDSEQRRRHKRDRDDGMVWEQNGRGLWKISPFPKVEIHCDPIINFKVKQRLKVLGASVTLGLDYLSDLSLWRTHLSVEDALLRGRFFLRGSEVGWTKMWGVGGGAGGTPLGKLKLRLGLNLQNPRFYAKLRLRLTPLSPLLGNMGGEGGLENGGLVVGGRVPLPLLLTPLSTLPLRVEYRVRMGLGGPSGVGGGGAGAGGSAAAPRLSLSTGLRKVDLSVDELNFCLEYDEDSPVWNFGIMKNQALRSKQRSTSK